jgi:hypothetical protein
MPLAELVQHQTVDARWGAFASGVLTNGALAALHALVFPHCLSI